MPGSIQSGNTIDLVEGSTGAGGLDNINRGAARPPIEFSIESVASSCEFTRVILESLAATYAKVARMLEELTGRKYTRLHIVGGGSQNQLLNQLAADATGMTVLAGPVEATALGNIITQAVSTGALPSIAAGRALVAKSLAAKPFLPRK